MADFLVLRLPADEERPVEWLIVDGQGARRSPPAAGTLEEAAEAASDHPVIVLVPGEEDGSCSIGTVQTVTAVCQ